MSSTPPAIAVRRVRQPASQCQPRGYTATAIMVGERRRRQPRLGPHSPARSTASSALDNQPRPTRQESSEKEPRSTTISPSHPRFYRLCIPTAFIVVGFLLRPDLTIVRLHRSGPTTGAQTHSTSPRVSSLPTPSSTPSGTTAGISFATAFSLPGPFSSPFCSRLL